eukprot:g12118.t1
MLFPTTRSLLFAGLAALTITPATTVWACPACAIGATQPAEVPNLTALPVVHQEPVAPLPAPVDPAPQADAADATLIQVAILLDTSNSMDGLIDQAKAQLWMIVNRFAKAQRDGVEPNFQIALFEYGNTSLPAEEGYIRQVVSFTDDLDKVSASLFALTTNGGDEYCGQVINEALDRLSWSEKANDFKAIYIAGNEPFTQGEVGYVGVCERAKGKGVLVNTIHCGKHDAGVSGMWQHGAHLAGGSFMTINQDRAVMAPPAPQDEALARLNTDLNGTYLYYGTRGAELKERQRELDDANGTLSNDAGAQRAVTKAGKYYSNAHWDLVDASTKEGFDLSKVPNEQLPEAMRTMSLEEKQVHIEAMAKQRKAIQDKIKSLAAERDAFIAEERREAAEAQGESLGEAINKTIDKQLQAQGYEVQQDEADKPEQPEPAEPEHKTEEAKAKAKK